MLARQLRGVGQARLVGILRLPLLVVLRGDTHAVGVALAVKVVEDILQLNAVFALAAGVGEVEHGAGTVVDSLLVVGRMAQVSTLLLLFVVGTEEVVEHVAVVLVGAAVVGGDQEGKGLVLRQPPTLAAVHSEREVAHGRDLLHAPVVVQPVAGQRHAVGYPLEAAQRLAHDVRAFVGRRGGGEERLAVGLVVHRTGKADRPTAVVRHIARGDEHHAAGEVGGVLGGGGLHDDHVVQLRGGQQVEGERARVGFAARHGGTVEPHLVVALRQTSHHHELIIYQRDARHAPNHLGGVFVLRPLDLFATDTFLNRQRLLGGLQHRHIAVRATLGDYGNLLQHLGVLVHVYI